MENLSGAEIIVEYLKKEKVPFVFTLCGHGNVGLLDVLLDNQTSIKTISVHHESVAGFMADAYFRISHQPVATLTSCGPGSANLPVALACAFMDSSAFLAITGNVPTTQFNRAPFQETGKYFQADFPSVIRSYVKRSYQATRSEQLPLMMRQAFSLMSNGNPGPVNLDVPLNVFVERADVEVPDPNDWHCSVSAHISAHQTDVEYVINELARAKRPLIVVGHGVERAEAENELNKVAELLQIPVSCTPLGKGCFDSRSPLSLGETGRNGTLTANSAARNADLILSLGAHFDDRATSSWLPGYTFEIPPTRLIQVDIDSTELGHNYPIELGIVANLKDFLVQLLAEAKAGNAAYSHTQVTTPREEWQAQIAIWKQEWDKLATKYRQSNASPIRPERLLAELRKALADDAILVSDVGSHHNWIVQEWQVHSPRSLLQSWGFASMGFGIAGALGAKLAAPDRQVVAIVGDGGFLMLPGAIATAVEYDIPVVWIVWNNGGFMSIRDIQTAYFGSERELATRFTYDRDGKQYCPDYVAMAKSMGAEGATINEPKDLANEIQKALEAHAPYVISVPIDSEARPIATGTWDLPPLEHPKPNVGLSASEGINVKNKVTPHA